MGAHLSLVEAAESFTAFMLANVPTGTEVELSAEYAEDISRTAQNQVAYGTANGIDVDKKRPDYEAVGWLCIQVEAWLFDSPYDDQLLSAWAKSILG